MTAKEYLNQVRLLELQINAKLEQVARLRSLTEKITVTLSPAAGTASPNPTALQDRILRLMEAEEELNADIDRLVDLKREIHGLLLQVEPPEYRLLLELRYLNGHEWPEIAEELGFCKRTLYRMHDQALEKVEAARRDATLTAL